MRRCFLALAMSCSGLMPLSAQEQRLILGDDSFPAVTPNLIHYLVAQNAVGQPHRMHDTVGGLWLLTLTLEFGQNLSDVASREELSFHLCAAFSGDGTYERHFQVREPYIPHFYVATLIVAKSWSTESTEASEPSVSEVPHWLDALMIHCFGSCMGR